jgi:ABC-type thiamin/hydroxymethylpyrimidine transport system permease subunit
MHGLVHNWFERHRHPASLALHAVGIPMLVAGLLLGAWQLWHGMWSLWWRPVGLIVISYVLQGIGEVVLIKKVLGRPYVAIAPTARKPAGEAEFTRRH